MTALDGRWIGDRRLGSVTDWPPEQSVSSTIAINEVEMSARALRCLRPTPFLCRARLIRETESRVLESRVLDRHGTTRNVRQPPTAGLGSPGSLSDATVSTESARPQRTTMGWPLAICLSHPVLIYRPQKQLDKSSGQRATAGGHLSPPKPHRVCLVDRGIGCRTFVCELNDRLRVDLIDERGRERSVCEIS